MTYRFTLIAAPHSTLSISMIEGVSRLFDDFSVDVANGPHWAAPRRAAWIEVKTPLRPDQMATVRLWCAADRIDVLQVPMMRAEDLKLMLCDMDSTILQGETLDDLAGLVGVRDAVAALTAKAMNGEMDYGQALAERLALIKGTGPGTLNKVLKNQRVSAGAATLVRTLNAYGVRSVLVSGGFTYFVEPVSKSLSFNDFHGNTLDLDANGCITGTVVEPLIHHTAKLEILKEYNVRLGTRTGQVIAVGDGANDVPMIQAAGFGFAYRPKLAVRDKVANHILYGDLTTILYAVGIPFDRFIPTPDPVFS